MEWKNRLKYMKNMMKSNTLCAMRMVSQQALDNKEEIRARGVSPSLTERCTPPFDGGAALARIARLMRAWWAGVNNASHPHQRSPLARPWSLKRIPMPSLVEYRIIYPMVNLSHEIAQQKQLLTDGKSVCCSRVAGTGPAEARPN